MKRLALLALLLASPAHANPWDSFMLIMWQDHSPTRLDGLRRMGFTGAQVIASGGDVSAEAVAQRQAAGLSYYLENIATDFYSPYHRWTPGKPVTWLFDGAKTRRRANPADTSVFIREPGLSDPAWLASIAARLDTLVRAHGPARPLFYNLGDEPGIGDLAAAWDADIGPTSLAAMREWLQTQYPSLDALNQQWGTSYAAWGDVQPELTDAAMARTDDNYSAWADFKAFMDVAFARALRAGTDAVHRADPAGIAALEGAQVPGWGGYDYGLLAGAVDAMEIYDSGNALDLAQAFNPRLLTLRTSFGTGAAEAQATWRFLLRGGRGVIVWDEADDVVRDDGAPGPRGAELSALVAELRAVAPLLRAAEPASDPVAILYSQASFRTRWMLDHRIKGASWSDRDAEREYDDNPWRAARRQAAGRLAELGVMPRWLSSGGVEAGALRDEALRVLVLPHAIALSDREIAEIRAFAARGGTVLADTEPGVFDNHSRRRTQMPTSLASLPLPLRPDADPTTPAMLDKLATVLRGAGVPHGMEVRTLEGTRPVGLDIRRFNNGGVTLMTFQANDPLNRADLIRMQAPPGSVLTLLRAPRAYLLNSGEASKTVSIGLEPVIVALSYAPLPGPVLAATVAGGQVQVRVSLDGPSVAAVDVVAVTVQDGTSAAGPSATLRLSGGTAQWDGPLPGAGPWTVKATALLGNKTASVALPAP